jgi:hypothetical protein
MTDRPGNRSFPLSLGRVKITWRAGLENTEISSAERICGGMQPGFAGKRGPAKPKRHDAAGNGDGITRYPLPLVV